MNTLPKNIPATSILHVLSLLPDGTSPGPLDFEQLGAYLGRLYNTDAEKDRNKRHALRDELYRDGGDDYMKSVIHEQFRDQTVRELRQKWIRHAKFNNAIKRIVNELSTVYAEPAKRKVAAGDDKYQEALKAIWMDEQMLQVSRLLNLHRALLVGVRVRLKPNGKREPLIQVATPAIVRAVLHPNDAMEVVGWLIRTDYRTCGPGGTNVPRQNQPIWTLWTDAESIQLREDLSVIATSYKTHPLGVVPWVPVSLSPPTPGFWPGMEGEDLVAAHVAIWMNNVLLMKESKSATKQAVLSGDTTTMARAQAADSEVPLEVPDGSSVSTLDMSMDLQPFRETSDHVLHHAGLNHGLSPGILDHQGVQSAEARELMRAPLKEQRKHQQIPLRRFEELFVVVLAAVLAADLPALAFKPDGFRVEFSEPEIVLSPADEHNLFEARRTAGLDNTVAMLMRLHPGMSEDEALELLEKNIEVEEIRQLAMRPMMAASGAAQGGTNNGGGVQAENPTAPLGAVDEVPPEQHTPVPRKQPAP